ncbi:hypothetical protein E1B28_006320 [Marasmius oreades]|uniref:BTB domain-containing protein n=1 Tax=Marasmius oreades TaxID=181124 RepID=A0A9P7S5L6_9AGAR|nr:uncharacterized protein E1B28_006320 [Marasmius oreades]KAG7095590.1 hypothetical protein E1B28_006320 [Marasmius oreades]
MQTRSPHIRPLSLTTPEQTHTVLASTPNSSIKSHDLWFEDGTLVIASENVLFRVYRGILSENSPVFADMVKFPQPHHVDEFEGCPVVQLYDAPNDVMHFLKALHCVSYFDVYMSQTIKWACFSAVLRLSTKYQVELLRRRAYTLLSSLYPTSLAKWDARDSITNLESFEARPFAVYLLAKEADLPTILPAALYLCADSRDINCILEGLDSYDNSHIELDWADKKACIRAREILCIALRTRMFAFLTGQIPFPGCRTTAMCNNTRLKWLQGVEASLGSGVFSVSFPWEQFSVGICEYCSTTSQNHYNAERRKIWDELPEIFGLPAWNQLHSE